MISYQRIMCIPFLWMISLQFLGRDTNVAIGFILLPSNINPSTSNAINSLSSSYSPSYSKSLQRTMKEQLNMEQKLLTLSSKRRFLYTKFQGEEQLPLNNDNNNNENDNYVEEIMMLNNNDWDCYDRRSFLAASILLSTIAFSSEISNANENNTISSPSLSSTITTSDTTTTSKSSNYNNNNNISIQDIFKQASKKALSGGKAGATASIVQVFSLMWLRTSMNYQYRYGGTLSSSLSTLYNEGGIARLYQGLPFALIQGPATRFGDTAANVGILVLLDSFPWSQTLPLPIKTGCGSLLAGLWRIFLMPIDTLKTVMQVEGQDGFQRIVDNMMKKSNVGVLYNGALASAAATAVGHFPWFLTFNYLSDVLPVITESSLSSSLASLTSSDSMEFVFTTLGVGMNGNEDTTTTTTILDSSSISSLVVLLGLVRSAVIGFAASCVSDTCSNSLRVIKTTKQTASLGDGSQEIRQQQEVSVPVVAEMKNDNIATTETKENEMFVNKKDLSYAEAVSLILEKDGWIGLFGRGLQTRLLTNAIQGAAFSVLWKYFSK